MAVTLRVPPQVLRQAKARWDDAADELDGSWRRLERSSTEGFSAQVASAVEAFREPWVDEIKTCARTAQGHSDDILLFGSTLVVTDVAAAERVRSALPWDQRRAPITGA